MNIKLFNKVFKNKYIFNLIYSYVCDDVLDWNIKSLLENKEYEKLDDLFKLNFELLSYNENENKNNQKRVLQLINEYWFYQLTPNQSDVLQLLRYKELGITRFIKFYQQYKSIFISLKNRVINESVKSGNMEIIKYLLNESFKYQVNKSYDFKNGAIPNVFDCGNNIEVFNFILESNPQINLNKESLIIDLISFYSEKGYFNLYPILLSNQIFNIINTITFSKLLNICFLNYDEQLLIQLKKFKTFSAIDESFIIGQVLKSTKLIMNDKYFKILNLFDNNIKIENTNFKSINNTDCFIYQLKLWEINDDDDDNFLKSIIGNGYYPNTIQEFKYIVEKPILKSKFFSIYNMYLFAKHLSIEICQLEYVQFFLNEYELFLKNTTPNNDYQNQYYICCRVFLDSTFEISNFIIQEKIQMISNYNFTDYYLLYTNCNLFFGNLELLKRCNNNINYVSTTTSYQLSTAAINGYYEILEYINQIIPINIKVGSNTLIQCNNNNQLKCFKFLIDNNRVNLLECKPLFEKNLYPIGTYYFKPEFLYYLFKSNIITSIPLFEQSSFTNLNIFHLYNNLYNNSKLLNRFLNFIENSNFQLFKELINLQDSSDGNQLIIVNHFNTNELKDQLISTLIKSGIKKLIYFILNSSIDVINQYYLLILKKVLFSPNISIINSKMVIYNLIKILNNNNNNNNNFNQDIKFNLIFNLILFSNKKNLIENNDSSNFITLSNLFNNLNINNFKLFINNQINTKDQFNLNYLNLIKDNNNNNNKDYLN